MSFFKRVTTNGAWCADMKLGMVAGEASGDLLGALLLEGFKQQSLEFEAFGIAGPRMQKLGVEAWWHSDALAVRGYVEVMRHYWRIVGIRNKITQRMKEAKPDLFIGVDAPDFNLVLERRLRQQGIRTIHMVCPSIWAWRPERINQIRESCDHVLCIFPFEVELLQSHGVSATYIGHPLADVMPMSPDAAYARERLGLSGEEAQGQVVALLPGSRLSEIEHLLPVFLDTVSILKQRLPSLNFVLPVAPGLMNRVNSYLAKHRAGAFIRCFQGQSQTAMVASDVVLVASGTATLEAALCKRPMVVAYRMPALSWWITQKKRLQPWVSLPNILCERFVVPEFLQDDCTAGNLAQSVQEQLQLSPSAQRAMRSTWDALHVSLMRNTSLTASQAVREVLAHA